jgi:Fe2+ or Zn2+ uptake regulation protein
MRDLSSATGFKIEGHWLELYGKCSQCRSRSKAVLVG